MKKMTSFITLTAVFGMAIAFQAFADMKEMKPIEQKMEHQMEGMKDVKPMMENKVEQGMKNDKAMMKPKMDKKMKEEKTMMENQMNKSMKHEEAMKPKM